MVGKIFFISGGLPLSVSSEKSSPAKDGEKRSGAINWDEMKNGRNQSRRKPSPLFTFRLIQHRSLFDRDGCRCLAYTYTGVYLPHPSSFSPLPGFPVIPTCQRQAVMIGLELLSCQQCTKHTPPNVLNRMDRQWESTLRMLFIMSTAAKAGFRCRAAERLQISTCSSSRLRRPNTRLNKLLHNTDHHQTAL